MTSKPQRFFHVWEIFGRFTAQSNPYSIVVDPKAWKQCPKGRSQAGEKVRKGADWWPQQGGSWWQWQMLVPILQATCPLTLFSSTSLKELDRSEETYKAVVLKLLVSLNPKVRVFGGGGRKQHDPQDHTTAGATRRPTYQSKRWLPGGMVNPMDTSAGLPKPCNIEK